jgi:hypothetical protein
MFAHSMKSPLLAVASLSLALITPIHGIAQPANLEEYYNDNPGHGNPALLRFLRRTENLRLPQRNAESPCATAAKR